MSKKHHRESFIGYSGSKVPKKQKTYSGQAIFDVGTKKKTKIATNAPSKSKPKKKGPGVDSQGRLDLASLAAQRLNFLDQYNQQVADINRNFEVQQQRLNANEPYVQRGILSDYAGRGMGHSSGYGDATGRETQLFNNQLNDLAYQHTYGLQDLNSQRTAMQRTLQIQREQIRQAAADRMAQQAGALGLYTGKKTVGTKKAKQLLGMP